jgi:serine protease inhibitor ecotin
LVVAQLLLLAVDAVVDVAVVAKCLQPLARNSPLPLARAGRNVKVQLLQLLRQRKDQAGVAKD